MRTFLDVPTPFLDCQGGINMLRSLLALLSQKVKVQCVAVVALAFLTSYLVALWPVLLGDIQTDISNGEIVSIRQGLSAITIFGIVYFIAECLTIVRRVAIDCIIAKNETEVRERTIAKLLRMPVSYLSGDLSGSTTAAINQGVAGLSQLIKIAVDVVAVVFIAVLTLGQVLRNAPSMLALLMFAYIVAAIVLSVAQIWSQKGIREKIVSLKNGLDGQICQSIANLEMIRAMGAESYETQRLRPSIKQIGRTEKTHHLWMGSFDSAKQGCKVVFQVAILAISIFMIADGQMSAGMVITVCLLFQQLIKPIDEIYRLLDESSSAMIKAKALVNIATSSSDPVFSIPSGQTKNKTNTTIEIDDLIVTNPEGTLPLASFDHISIPCDSIVALQGANGSGKSTLIRAINRYYPYSHGQISILGVDQSALSQEELTDLIYYSPQTSMFIAGTVRDNLHFGLDHDVSDEELAEALHSVHLVGEDHTDTVIHISAACALNSQLGEGAKELSGGQRQRLALARAFLRNPRLFIFDEITANLDANAMNTVLSNIEAYAHRIDAGIVYISHDPKVVARCQSVIKLHNRLRDSTNAPADVVDIYRGHLARAI